MGRRPLGYSKALIARAFQLGDLLSAFHTDLIKSWKVDPRVRDVRNNDEALCDEDY